jgi:hypothetical protein
MLDTFPTVGPRDSLIDSVLRTPPESPIAQGWPKPPTYPGSDPRIHVNFYTNMVSDRVGDKPQTLILPLTRSIPLWARVSGPSAEKNKGKLQPKTRPLGKGYNRGESLPFGEVELMETL